MTTMHTLYSSEHYGFNSGLFVNFTVFIFVFPFALACFLYLSNSLLTFRVINTVVNNITICEASLMDGDIIPDKGSSK